MKKIVIGTVISLVLVSILWLFDPKLGDFVSCFGMSAVLLVVGAIFIFEVARDICEGALVAGVTFILLAGFFAYLPLNYYGYIG